MKTNKRDGWFGVSILLLAIFIIFLAFPLMGLLKQSVYNEAGELSLENFVRFFTYTNGYYLKPIWNSVKVTIATTIVSLLLGIPIAYFYSFYKIRGAKILFVVSILCSMSAPFIGAYSWILLLGRSGAITKMISSLIGFKMPAIYGFHGILLVQSLKFFPLVFIYMNGAFKNIDNTLMEAAANMGCTGVKRLIRIVLALSMPTILAAALMVFMQAFADFGTPMLIGEGYQTFPVMIYNAYLGEGGTNRNFAAALAVVAIVITAIVFFFQKWGTSRFKFSMNALHPVEKKEAKGISGLLMHLYCYLLVGIAFMPQLYIIYLGVFSFIEVPKMTIFGFLRLDLFIPSVVALALNSSAYVAEIFRAGILAVDAGQTEAARSLGLSSWQSMRLVVLPQAVKNVLPALANEVVTMVKESSICSTYGMMELMWGAKTVAATTYVTLGPYVLAAIIYFCVNFPASKAIEAVERRMRRGDNQ